MGSRLTILATQLIVVASAVRAEAQSPAELFKKGVELYKAGKYDAAAQALEKSYQLDATPETLFALAQAERLGGKCDKAVPRYQQLLAQTTELATAKAVQNNLALCPQPEPEPAPKVEPAPAAVVEPPPAAPPTMVVREVRSTDGLGLVMLGTGALGAGVAGGFLLRSRSSRDDASRARTLDDANALHDRADRDRVIAIAVGGASAVALGFAIYRLARGGSEASATDIALTPTVGGSMMVLSRTW